MAGAFANPQLFAAILCLLLPVAWTAARAEQHPRRHILALVAAVLALGGVLVSQNRSVWIASALALGVLLVLHLVYGQREEGPGLQKQHLIVPGIMVALCVVLFVGMAKRGWSLPERAATLAALARDRSYRQRLGMWSKALEMARERPLWGWGAGLYPVRQARFSHPDVPAADEETILRTGSTLSENAHNTYLQILAEMGIPGLALYLGVFAAFFGTALRALPRLRARYRRSILMAAVAAVAGQMACAVGNPAWEFAECSLFLWLVLGLGMAAAGVGERA